jgi:hypothetical protein
VIALGLTAILLTTLFSCYHRLVIFKTQIEGVRNQLYPQLLTQARLIQVFDGLHEGASLFTNSEALGLTFDNGIDHDPDYCIFQEVNLSKSAENQFVITYKNKQRKEVLKEKISSLSFSFFDANEEGWVNKWRGSTLPAQIRLNLDSETYTFSLPHSGQRAVYK